MFRRFVETILILKWPIALALLLMTFVTGLALPKLHIDPSVESLFNKNSSVYRYYRRFTQQYGSDRVIVIAMHTSDIFKLQNLKVILALTKTLENFDDVERVLSLANAMDIRHKFLGVKIVPAIEDYLEGKQSLEELRERILGNELYRHNLISQDGKTASILVFLSIPEGRRTAHGAFIVQLERIVDSYRTPGRRFFIAGFPIEQYEFVRLIRRDQFTFIPLILLLLVIMTTFFYRSLSCTILAITIVLMSLVWTLGTISLLGQELNLVTSLLAPVIMIVAIANSVHLMNLFFEIRAHHSSLRYSIVLTFQQLGVPALLTHLTTICGFAALIFTPVPAIQSFGAFAALGTFYSYLIEILLTPLLLPTLPYRPTGHSFDEKHWVNRILILFLEKFEFRWKWIILGGALVVFILSILGIQRITIDTNIIRQMKPHSRLAQATRFIDQHLMGVYTLGFVLRRKDGQAMMEPEILQRIDAFKDYLESKPAITNVNSITTFIKKTSQAWKEEEAYRIPEDRELVRRFLEGMVASEDRQILSLISKDLREVRLAARMKAVGTQRGAQLEREVRQYLDENLSDVLDYRLTGNVVLLGQMAEELVHHQMAGFRLVFFSIITLITLFFRSLTMGLLAVIPNLLPILAVYGVMGFLGIELSTPTAMISTVVLGMIVDASIHFLHRFRLEFEKRQHYLQALHHTYRNVGQALLISSAILIIGFASSIFASFRSTTYFGLLTSCTILFALFCTLMILPVCLVVLKPLGPQRLFKRPS